jgi:hypothetical protein
MDFSLPIDADAIFEASVGFMNDGSEAPSLGGFDLLDEVDAVRVVGSVEKSPSGLTVGRVLFRRTTLSKRHQGANLLIPKVAG